jgi:hypothetical protein
MEDEMPQRYICRIDWTDAQGAQQSIEHGELAEGAFPSDVAYNAMTRATAKGWKRPNGFEPVVSVAEISGRAKL